MENEEKKKKGRPAKKKQETEKIEKKEEGIEIQDNDSINLLKDQIIKSIKANIKAFPKCKDLSLILLEKITDPEATKEDIMKAIKDLYPDYQNWIKANKFQWRSEILKEDNFIISRNVAFLYCIPSGKNLKVIIQMYKSTSENDLIEAVNTMEVRARKKNKAKIVIDPAEFKEAGKVLTDMNYQLKEDKLYHKAI